jgi:hypothetical protein
MKTLFYIIIIFLSLLLGCKQKLTNKIKTEVLSVFSDSTEVAVKGGTKVVLTRVLIDDSVSKMYFDCYTKDNNNWKLTSHLEEDLWSVDNSIDVKDFNADSYADIIFLKGRGARGGNVIMSLYIFNPITNSFYYVENSNDYPNLYFNAKTKTINSYSLSGSSNITIFLTLNNKTLTPIASVEQYNETNVSVQEYDSIGNSKIIFFDSSTKYQPFEQFNNYKPLEIEQ